MRAAPGRIVLDGDEVTWPADAAWEPRLARVAAGRAGALRERGDGDPRRARAARRPAMRTSSARSAIATPPAAARAADRLIGLGGGLTPEGDDVLAATAAVVVAAGNAVGFAGTERARFVAALVPGRRAARTTALSATLLALAAEGRIVEPVHRLLDPTPATAWRDALATLAATGASTGRA